jgi:hypothetical protein
MASFIEKNRGEHLSAPAGGGSYTPNIVARPISAMGKESAASTSFKPTLSLQERAKSRQVSSYADYTIGSIERAVSDLKHISTRLDTETEILKFRNPGKVHAISDKCNELSKRLDIGPNPKNIIQASSAEIEKANKKYKEGGDEFIKFIRDKIGETDGRCESVRDLKRGFDSLREVLIAANTHEDTGLSYASAYLNEQLKFGWNRLQDIQTENGIQHVIRPSNQNVTRDELLDELARTFESIDVEKIGKQFDQLVTAKLVQDHLTKVNDLLEKGKTQEAEALLASSSIGLLQELKDVGTGKTDTATDLPHLEISMDKKVEDTHEKEESQRLEQGMRLSM